MKKTAKIGEQAPLLSLSHWVKGTPTNLDQHSGQVVLVEIFQVNCPGCFLYSLPQAIDLYQRYYDKGLTVLGLATAFEDFDKNTLDSLKLLVNENIVIGETFRLLKQQNRLIDGRLAYSLPFPVAMDNIVQKQQEFTDDAIDDLISKHIPDFIHKNKQEQHQLYQQARLFLQSRMYSPETFILYQLQGTPSHILVDKNGILRACEFGDFPDLEWLVTSFLHE